MQVTRIELPQLPEAVQESLRLIRAAGGRAWVVGGAVRDLLRGETPEDFDLASDLTPEQLATILPDPEVRAAAFGTCRTTIAGKHLAVTTLRAEADYSDQRHPDTVTFVTDLGVDARRRDFTINALYFDPATGELSDPHGGQQDLQQKVLRTIGEPERRFREDPLRLLRMVRFAASADLRLAPEVAAAARATASGLNSLSAERTFEELTRTFCGPGRGRGLGILVETGLADVVLPEVAKMAGVPQPPEYHPEGDVLVHVQLVLDHCPPDDAILAWSAVLHDIGKPPTFRVADRIRFDGHDTLSATMAEQVLTRLRAPKSLKKRVVDICLQHIRFAALPLMRPARAERWLREPDFPLHLAFHRADCLGSHGKLEIHEFAERLLRELPPLRKPLVHGKDVLALGIASGPQVGKLLALVQARIDESPVATSREQALVLLRDEVSRHRQDDDDTAR